MKIVHINTYDTGGAATSALRIHQGLLQQNIDSSFLCLYKKDNKQPNKIKYSFPYIKPTIYQRIKNKLGFYKQTQEQENAELIKDVKGQYEIYSFPLTDYKVEDHPLVKEADIIHLHWVANFINYPSFFSNIKKPIVWTLHDMNPFLGGFHYQQDVERNKNAFENLEEKLINIKAEAIYKTDKLTVVSPSAWLGESAKQSLVFKKASFRHIVYGLDLKTFKINDAIFARHVFNLPIDKKIILFVSASLNNYRKGFDLVVKAIENSDLGDEFVLVIIGETNAELLKKENIFNIGLVEDERIMSLLYSSADLFILPSREDNLPNVMLESLACGTPVLSFKVGGMFEIIQRGFTGFFADFISAESLANAINSFCNDEFCFDKKAIRDFAEREFSLEKQALSYINLYKEVIKDRA